MTYKKRFITVISTALTLNFEIESIDPSSGCFILLNRETGEKHRLFDSDDGLQSQVIQSDLERFECLIEDLYQKHEESLRIDTLRKMALSKLTIDEKEALGIL